MTTTGEPGNLPALRLEYDGRLGELYRIFFGNLLLTLLTLGVYRFWATTRTRRYLWSHMRFMGDRFEYTGTGGEKFRGFLLAMLVLACIAGVNFGITFLAQSTGHAWLSALSWPTSLVYGALFGAAAYSAQRYRLSRTQWRGIRGGMVRGALAYGCTSLWCGVLAVLSLGLAWPVLRLGLLQRRINASAFGNKRLSVRGQANALYPGFLLTLPLFLGMVGLLILLDAAGFALLNKSAETSASALVANKLLIFVEGFFTIFVFIPLSKAATAWFDAAMARQLLGSLKYADFRFATSITGGAVFRLRLVNTLISLLTLGFGSPIVTQRCARFIAAKIQVLGSADVASLLQNTMSAPRRGEGLLEALDVGIVG